MKPGPDAIKLIQYFEQCRLTAYQDVKGVWTIGWGSTGPDVRRGVSWSQTQCDARFSTDFNAFSVGVSKLIGSHPTTQGQFDGLVSFAYNCGLGNLSSSTLLKMHLAGNYKGAAGEFVKWDHADGKEVRGLKVRRMTEAAVYNGPVDVAKTAQQILRSLM